MVITHHYRTSLTFMKLFYKNRGVLMLDILWSDLKP